MRKVVHVAVREFVSTVSTKGFVIGVLIVPALVVVMIVALPALINETPPPVGGTMALIDQSGQTTDLIVSRINPAALARAREAEVEQRAAMMAAAAGKELGEVADFRAQAEKQVAPPMSVRVEVLDPQTDPEQAKEPLKTGAVRDAGRQALVVVEPNAVAPDDQGRYGSYRWYARPHLDDRAQEVLRRTVNGAIVDSRLQRLGHDPAQLRAMMNANASEAKTVTESGEIASKAGEVLAMLMPIGFMMLLWVSVFTGGQYLLTTTIEEKSSRVIEVLLSAVSPVQLMTGKIIGQLGVGLLILAVYCGLGVSAMVSFAVLGFLEWVDLVYLGAFFLIAFFFIAAMMAAIGAAVNDAREAQSLMGPVMIVLIIPMMLWMPIARDPNSLFATILGLVPPVSPFVMIVRLASNQPIPVWQVIASIVIGVLAVYLMIRFAAKIFRVGVLMYGKPPNLRTLVRWVRMA